MKYRYINEKQKNKRNIDIINDITLAVISDEGIRPKLS